ncbi:unnamed protein product [Clonostachys byssicola]|uniref:Uncharacterized protein n=1 Tax=Clonostachys byssicola TaxID=160290 RepID=A0A9N9Y1H0_9HYPO|nr:unnamed protein product [Clonostachys byssicola]
MTGISQYKHDEIRFVLREIVRKTKLPSISEGFFNRFTKTLNPNQIRYIKNKYGKDPTFKSPMINYRGANAADLEDSDNAQEEKSGWVNHPLLLAPENHTPREQSKSPELLASQNPIPAGPSLPNPLTTTKGHESPVSLVPGWAQRREQGIYFQPINRTLQQPQDLNIPSQILPAEPDLSQQPLIPAAQASNIAQTPGGWVHLPPSQFPYYTQMPVANTGWGQGAHQFYPGSIHNSPVFFPDNSMPISNLQAGYYGGIEPVSQGFHYPTQSPRFVDIPSGSMPRSLQMIQENIISSPRPNDAPPRASSSKKGQTTATPSSRPESAIRTRRHNVSGTGYNVHGIRPRRIAKAAHLTRFPESYNGVLSNFVHDMSEPVTGVPEPSLPSLPSLPSQTPRNQDGRGTGGHFEDLNLDFAIDPIAKYTNYPPSEPEYAEIKPGGGSGASPELVDTAPSPTGAGPSLSLPASSQPLGSSNLLESIESPSEFVPVQTTPLIPSVSPFLPTHSQAMSFKLNATERNGERDKGKEKGKEISNEVIEAREARRRQEIIRKNNIQTALNQMFQRDEALRRAAGTQEVAQAAFETQNPPKTQGESASQLLTHGEYQSCAKSQHQTEASASRSDMLPLDQVVLQPLSPGQSSKNITYEEMKSWGEGMVGSDVLHETLLSLDCDAPIDSTERVVEL